MKFQTKALLIAFGLLSADLALAAGGIQDVESLSKTIYTYIQGTAYVIAGIAGLVFMLKVFFFKQMLSECVPWFAACVGCASVGFFVNMIFGKTI